MKKVLSVLLAVLCLTLVLTTTVSAGLGHSSFTEGGVNVQNDDDGHTYVKKDVEDSDITWVLNAETRTLVKSSSPAAADIENDFKNYGCTGFPSTSTNDVTLVGNFFDVHLYTGADKAKFTVESDKIVAGVQVGVAHFSKVSNWEFVAAKSVDTTNHTASFELNDGSPVILVVYKAKTSPAPSGVVNTATY